MNRSLHKPAYLPYLCAAFLAIFYFLFNMHYMSQFVDYDQVAYAININYMEPISRPFYNPHHIHFEFTGKLFHWWMVDNWGDSGFTNLIFNMKIRSLLAACIGIFFMVLYLKNITGKLLWGIAGGLLLGFCHGYLNYAVKVDTAIFPAAAFVLILWIHNKIEQSKNKAVVYSILGGIILCISVLMHQYMAIACAAACFTIILPPYLFQNKRLSASFTVIKKDAPAQIDKQPVSRYFSAVLMSIIGILLICVSYFFVGKIEYRLSFDKPTPHLSRGLWRDLTFQQWFCGYSRINVWGKGFVDFDPGRPIGGFTDAFLSQSGSLKKYFTEWAFKNEYKFLYNLQEPFSPKSFVHNQVLILTLIALLGTFFLFPFLLKRYKRHLLFLILSAIGFIIFFSYWEPIYFEFWLIPVEIICVLVILISNYGGERLGLFFKRSGQFPFYAFIFFVIISFSSHNMLYYLLPHSKVRLLEGVARESTVKNYKKYFTFSVYKKTYEEGYTITQKIEKILPFLKKK